MTASATTTHPKDPEKLGRYDVQGKLGRGAMGVVYLGRDPVIERTVALKTILPRPDLDVEVMEERRTRFFHEAKAVGQLNHPNIVTLYDAGEDEATGLSFMAMEHVVGATLEEALRAGVSFSFEQASSIAAQVAAALDYAHRRGVIHRDVKPANIILSDDGTVKLADFGIARVQSSLEMTQPGQLMGTPHYMAPEQLRGGIVDHRVDIFSLGVVMYRLWTGHYPFDGEDATSLSYQIVHEEPSRPTALRPELPEICDRIIGRALAKEARLRYDNGAELVGELGRDGIVPLPGILKRDLPAPPAEVETIMVPLAQRDATTAGMVSADALAPHLASSTTGTPAAQELPWGLAGAALVLVALVAIYRLVTPPGPSALQVADPKVVDDAASATTSGEQVVDVTPPDQGPQQPPAEAETVPAAPPTLVAEAKPAPTPTRRASREPAADPRTSPSPHVVAAAPSSRRGVAANLLYQNEHASGSLRIDLGDGSRALDVALALPAGKDEQQVVRRFEIPLGIRALIVRLQVPEKDLDLSQTIEVPEDESEELSLLVKRRKFPSNKLQLEWK